MPAWRAAGTAKLAIRSDALVALIASLTQSTTWPTIDSRAARFSSVLRLAKP